MVTGRVTDAVAGRRARGVVARLGPDDWDALAGAVVAGHVIECGPQATGGNYAFLDEITDRRYPGFPIAEVAEDGSSVITKHPDTGGLVTVGTVTAQLLYEIAGPAYLGPDVTSALRHDRAGPGGTSDRVAITGVRGSAPPPTLKVALNDVGGFRNTMTLVLTGLDVEAKAARAEELLFAVLGGKGRFAEVDVRLLRFDRPDAPSNEQATAHLRVTVKDPDPRKVGRAFSNATMELALGGYAGFHTTTPPTAESAFGVYRPAAVPRTAVTQAVVLPGGERRVIPDPPTTDPPTAAAAADPALIAADAVAAAPAAAEPATAGPAAAAGCAAAGHVAAICTDTGRVAAGTADTGRVAVGPADTGRVAGPTVRAPLGRVAGARSGDKGGNANIGLWARDDAGYAWLAAFLTAERVRELLGPEAAALPIDAYPLPNLRAVNVVVHGLLGDGVASSTRPDPQAKGLGEYLRSRVVDVPEDLL